MARNEQLIRQHRILQLLEVSRYGRTLDELRQALVEDLGLGSLHERTVRRDIEALEAAGFQLIDEATPRGRVIKMGRADKGIHRISATATELISLSIGRELLVPLLGTHYWQGIESFWNKVREALPESVWEHYERHRRAVHVLGAPAKDYARHEGMLRTINRAILQHRVLDVSYAAAGKPPLQRRLEPYGIAVYQSSLYVVAAATEIEDPQDRIRHWKLDRFQSVVALDEYFKPDPDIDLERWLGKSIGIFSGEAASEVKIRLSTRAATWVREDPWHPEQRWEEQADGSGVVSVPAAHPRELMPRVLALGAEAEVIEPVEFREVIAEEVRKLADAYAVRGP
jgi:predicted DNA-binding transcriptional regulator YafY